MSTYSRTERETTRQASQASRTMSDAAERTAKAGAEAWRHNAESFSSAWKDSSETAARIAERSMDQFSKLFGLNGDTARQAMEQSAGNVQALIDSSTVMAGALQGVSSEWMRFLQQRVEGNLERMDEFLGCRSPHECVELQTRMVRENVEALLQTARRTSELSTELAESAVNKVSEARLQPEH